MERCKVCVVKDYVEVLNVFNIWISFLVCLSSEFVCEVFSSSSLIPFYVSHPYLSLCSILYEELVIASGELLIDVSNFNMPLTC